MFKSIITVVLALVMLFSFVACGNNDKNNNGVTDSQDTRGINDNMNGYDILDDSGITGNGGMLNNNSRNDMMNGTGMGSR